MDAMMTLPAKSAKNDDAAPLSFRNIDELTVATVAAMTGSCGPLHLRLDAVAEFLWLLDAN